MHTVYVNAVAAEIEMQLVFTADKYNLIEAFY
jgi:hypothetical protein